MFNIIQENEPLIKNITTKLCKKNPDYTYTEIYNMVMTSLWESYKKNKKINFIEIYTNTLNRILEEKGFKYMNGSLVNIMINGEATSNHKYYDKIRQPDYTHILNAIFRYSKLSQLEIFIVALSFNLDTPEDLKGKYKEKLDNIEPLYYTRKLTKQEIAKICETSTANVTRVQKQALKKMEQYCGTQF